MAPTIVKYTTPPGVNWNKLVDDQYRAGEAGKVKLVHLGEVKGEPAWANGYMLEIADVPERLKALKKYREGAVDTEGKRRVFTSLVPETSASDTIVRPLASTTEEKTPVPRGVPSITYLSNDGKEFTAQTKYIDYFLIRYPDAQFIVQKSNSPMVVKSKGKTVGVIMPIKVEDSIILQIRDFLRVAPPAKPTEKPPVPPAGITVGEAETRYSRKQLEDMALQAGIGTAGSKRELCRALVRSGVVK